MRSTNPPYKKKFNPAVLLAIIFAAISLLIAVNDTLTVDLELTLFLQSIIPRNMDLLFSVLSFLGSAEITTIVWLVLVAFFKAQKYVFTIIALFLFPLASFIELLGKIAIHHPSPPYSLYRGVLNIHLPSQLVDTGSSYPSGHVTRVAFLITFILVLISLNKFKQKLAIQCVLISILILTIISRVYLGEHWATDVLGGYLLGTSFGLFSAALLLPAKT